MRTLLITPVFIAIVLIILLTFKNINPKTVRISTPRTKAIVCAPTYDNTVAAAPFVLRQTSSGPLIRRDIYSLSTRDINYIKTGISAMKSLPYTDPTSWTYQAAIHGTNATNNLQSWNSCQHHTIFFFSWHRMYLYFFERILRAKSGNPNLTLPYWNYQSNAVLPPAYRDSKKSNPLYDGTRFASINGGGALPSSISDAINNCLSDGPFYNYQGDLEDPHGAVHTSIGGNMGSVPTAGQDPVFFLHHANIDRLWEAWIRQCGGRVSPTASDTTWWNQSFTFFDENRKAVVMTGSQIVNTASQLNYQYDFSPATVTCPAARANQASRSLPISNLIKMTDVIRLNQNNLRVSLSNAKRDSLEAFLKTTNNRSLGPVANGMNQNRLSVVIEIFKINKAPEGVIEVYLNLPPNEIANSKSKSFVGVLDLFTASAHMHHNEEEHNTNKLNATNAANAIKLDMSKLGDGHLTFVVRGNTLPDGTEVKTDSDVQLGNISFVIEKSGQ